MRPVPVHFSASSKNIISGFSLVEVTLAMGLVSFCLVAMLGMLPVGLNQEQRSTEQLNAMHVIAAISSDFQTGSAVSTPRFGLPLAAAGSGAFLVNRALEIASSSDDAEYKVWYRLAPASTDSARGQMHVFVSRARPSDTVTGSLAELTGRDYVEGIVQQRFN